MKSIKKLIHILILTITTTLTACNEPQPLKVLIVSGENNHNWQVSHPVLQLILDNSGMFVTDIALTASKEENMSNFHLKFDDYENRKHTVI